MTKTTFLQEAKEELDIKLVKETNQKKILTKLSNGYDIQLFEHEVDNEYNRLLTLVSNKNDEGILEFFTGDSDNLVESAKTLVFSYKRLTEEASTANKGLLDAASKIAGIGKKATQANPKKKASLAQAIKNFLSLKDETSAWTLIKVVIYAMGSQVAIMVARNVAVGALGAVASPATFVAAIVVLIIAALALIKVAWMAGKKLGSMSDTGAHNKILVGILSFLSGSLLGLLSFMLNVDDQKKLKALKSKASSFLGKAKSIKK